MLLRSCRLMFFLWISLVSLNLSAARFVVFVGAFADKALLVIDGQRHILSVNGKTVAGVQLIAVDVEQARVRIDGRPVVLNLGASVGSIDDSGSVRVHVLPDAQGMYFTNGLINGYPVRFMIDTGATLVVMNSDTAKRLGIRYRVDGREGRALTASGSVRTYNLVLRSVTVGGIKVRRVRASVVQGKYPVQILLGMSFLKRIKMENQGKALVLIQ